MIRSAGRREMLYKDEWITFQEKLVNAINIEKKLMETTGYIDGIPEKFKSEQCTRHWISCDIWELGPKLRDIPLLSGIASSVLERWEMVKKTELKLNNGSTSSDSKDVIEKKKMIMRFIQSALKNIIKHGDKTSLYSDNSTELSSKSSSTGELELQDIESNETKSAGELVLTIQSSESRSVNHSDETGLDELAILNIQSNEAGPVPKKLEMGSSNNTKSSGELELQGIGSDETELA
ncbi:hypothetical protein BDQ17DRAFT_1450383 [Cyathus striatus]|nr:hypothetical protein BDQ17DRAFT_1450383 [Cyathus striatus]